MHPEKHDGDTIYIHNVVNTAHVVNRVSDLERTAVKKFGEKKKDWLLTRSE